MVKCQVVKIALCRVDDSLDLWIFPVIVHTISAKGWTNISYYIQYYNYTFCCMGQLNLVGCVASEIKLLCMSFYNTLKIEY